MFNVFGRTIVQPGAEVSLRCSASGDPLPNIGWFLRGSVINSDSVLPDIKNFVGIDKVTSTLLIQRTKQSDGGLYSCTATNRIGQDTHQQMLDVYGPPVVWPLANKTVQAGHEFALGCHYSGYPITSIKWAKGNVCFIVERSLF